MEVYKLVIQKLKPYLNKKNIIPVAFAILVMVAIIIPYTLARKRLTTDSQASTLANLALTYGKVTVPNSTTITNKSGSVSIGASNIYGGGVVYYRDSKLPQSKATDLGKGNIIDFFQGGALLSHAIWTYPRTMSEQQLCSQSNQHILKVPEWKETDAKCYVNNKMSSSKDADDVCYCKHTVPHNNPTQGGTTGDGHYGNPNTFNNPDSVKVVNNKIVSSVRLVNFNFGLPGSEMTEANKSKWQTDLWIDQEISFHPRLDDVVVMDTKVTYCKDKNPGCANKPIVFADNQLMTLFASGPTTARYPDVPNWRGPYSRVAYADKAGSYKYLGTNFSSSPIKMPIKNSKGANDPAIDSENWIATLQETTNTGVGLSVQNYQPVPTYNNNPGGGYLARGEDDGWPVTAAIRPQLDKFENSGIIRINPGEKFDKGIASTYDKSLLKIFDYQTSVPVNDVSVLYSALPGGWFKYKGYMTTGSLDVIRKNLNTAPIMSTESAVGAINKATSTEISGWALDKDIAGPVDVHIYVNGKFAKAVTANDAWPDPNIGNHGFVWSNPVLSNGNNEIRAYVIGVNKAGAPDGNNPQLMNSPKTTSSTKIEQPAVPQPNSGVQAVNNKIATGAFGTVNRNVISGWAVDEDNLGLNVYVHIYVNGKFFKDVLANGYWPDPKIGNHGFSITNPGLPAGNLEIRAYVINVNSVGVPGGQNKEIQLSPVKIK